MIETRIKEIWEPGEYDWSEAYLIKAYIWKKVSWKNFFQPTRITCATSFVHSLDLWGMRIRLYLMLTYHLFQTTIFSCWLYVVMKYFVLLYWAGRKGFKLDRGSIGTSPMYGIGSPPKKYKDTSLTLIDIPTPKSYRLLITFSLIM